MRSGGGATYFLKSFSIFPIYRPARPPTVTSGSVKINRSLLLVPTATKHQYLIFSADAIPSGRKTFRGIFFKIFYNWTINFPFFPFVSTECLFLAVKLHLFSMTTVCGQPPLQDGWWSCMVYYLFVSSVRRMWVMSWPKGDKNTVNIIAEPGERKRAVWHHRSLSEEFTVLTKDREKASLTLTQTASLVTWWLKII